MRLSGALLKSVNVVAIVASGAFQASARPVPAQAQSSVEAFQPSFESISSYQGLSVSEIEFPDVAEGDKKRFRELILQQAGKPLDRELIRQSIQALYATGRFADLQVQVQRDASGQVRLSFITSPNYFIGKISVAGAPSRPAESQVANAAKLTLGELFTREKLDRALKNIKQLMEENGYYHSLISEEEEKHPDTEQVDIFFHVTPGTQA